MDLFFLGFNASKANPVTLSTFAGFVYLLAWIWLSLFLTRPAKQQGPLPRQAGRPYRAGATISSGLILQIIA